MRYLGAALVAIAVSSGNAHAEGSLACEREMTRAAAQHGVPLNVLYSVGLTETGSRGGLSPYDMNVDGQAVHSTSLAEAMARFAQAKGRGAKFIDIGCMQINHHFHSADFHSLSEMFDPARNVEYAANFLKSLKAQEGSWTLAVARYNAGPGNPAAEKLTSARLSATWSRAASGNGRPTPAPSASSLLWRRRPDAAPAHKVTRLNHFMVLGALSRNFFGEPAFSSPRSDEGGRPARFVSGQDEAAKNETLISPCETKRFAWHGVSHCNLYGRQISHFAVLFVFNGLDLFSFRRFRRRHRPALAYILVNARAQSRYLAIVAGIS